MFENIRGYENWESIEKLSRGWSDDEKYVVKTTAGELFLLRLSGIEQYDAKKKEYEIIAKYATLGFLMSQPIDFGICNNGRNVYILLTWIEGVDLEAALPTLSESEQYKLGREAGKISGLC